MLKPSHFAIALALIFTPISTKVIQSLLYGASPTSVPTTVGGVLALILVGLIASFVPARRAARVSPVTALRSE